MQFSKVDYDDIISKLECLRIENAKIVISSKHILEDADRLFGNKPKKFQKLTEKWFKTHYRKYPKPIKQINGLI